MRYPRFRGSCEIFRCYTTLHRLLIFTSDTTNNKDDETVQETSINQVSSKNIYTYTGYVDISLTDNSTDTFNK